MDDKAKIHLSKDESDLVTNTEWILTKQRIITKVYDMFGELSQIMKVESDNSENVFPENIKYGGGKITKGENYQFLPYVILDCPSVFGKEDIFAVRSMFWWGNFFSITLHLSGRNKIKFINNDPALLNYLREKDFFICTNQDQWHHHFNHDNYTAASQLSWMQFQKNTEKYFFKIAKRIPLSEWNEAINFFRKGFIDIKEFLQISSQACKKDL